MGSRKLGATFLIIERIKMNQVIFESTFYDKNLVQSCTMLEHDHEIHSLLFDLNKSGIDLIRGADDMYLIGEGSEMETLSLPEVKSVEKLADCQCYSRQVGNQVEFIWIPFEVFDDLD